MLNTSDVKSLSKGGTTVSLEEISNSIDNKLSIDNLTGSNGIEIVKNAAEDKVEVKLSNSGFTIGDTNYQTITINPNGHGEYRDAYISVNYDGSSVYSEITPYDIRFYDNGSISHGLTSSNVKTVNGQSIYGSGNIDTTPALKTINSQSILGSGNINTTPTLKTINSQSILGSGNIDTTPTLKTINSQSITGSGNINTLKVYHGNEWNPEIASDFDGGVWVGYRTLSSGQDPTGTGTTSVDINAFKFGNGRGSGGFSDVYCKKLYTSSDERLKENIKSYEPKVSVLDLSIKEFNYKDSKVKSVGVIAQEVQKLFPDAVSADKKSGYLSVDDRSLMYMLIAEVKKLRDRVNELEGK